MLYNMAAMKYPNLPKKIVGCAEEAFLTVYISDRTQYCTEIT